MKPLHRYDLLFFLTAVLATAVATSVLADHAGPPRYLNLDFETLHRPKGWSFGGRGYTGGIDTEEAYSGRQSMRLTHVSQGMFGVATTTFPADHALEKTVQYTGYIKTRGVEQGYAGLWWRVEGERQEILAFDNMSGRGITGDTEWQRAEIVLHVPHGATSITFGLILTGKGEAWFDALKIRLSGELYTQTEPPPPPPPSEEALDAIRQHAHAFDTVEAGQGFGDLRFLDGLISKARIVALGEVTHGSRDIFQMKHRMFEYLVENMGVRLFAMEANMPEAYRMNEYVLTGKGDPRDLLTGMYFWTWNTREVLDMVEWMREFNTNLAPGDEPVQFLGFDMQFPAGAQENVRWFMEVYDPEFVPRLTGTFKALDKIYEANKVAAPKFGQDEAFLEMTWKRLTRRLASEADVYASSAGPERVAWLHQNVRVLKQCLDMGVINEPTKRDQSMAENITWILDQNPGARIVLWAHNGHVGRRPGSMGAFLDEKFPGEMVVFGFSFHDGQYTARAIEDRALTHHQAFPAGMGSAEYVLHETGMPRLMLDLRTIEADSPLAPWFREAVEMRSTGAVETTYGFTEVVIADSYDVLVFLDHTEATESLREDFVEPGR